MAKTKGQRERESEMGDEKPPFLIPQIAGSLVWLETLLVTVSSLMLTFVAVLTVASALNGGKLLADNPALSAAYAWCQGLGIEGQLSGMTFQAVRAAKQGRGGQSAWYWLIALVLGFASFLAIGAVNYQESFGVPFADSLAAVGIDQHTWVWMRSGILVALLMLAAAMRYQPVVRESVDEKIRKMQDQAKLNQARAAVMSSGLGAMIKGVKGAVESSVSESAAEVPNS